MPRPPKDNPADADDRILDAAEKLFGEHGFAGTSLRQITTRAKVNLAAVNYHFGSKEELYAQVFVRRIEPINARRIALLDEAAHLSGDHPVPLRAILESFIRPVFEMAAHTPTFLPLLGRNLSAPPPFMTAVIERHFGPLIARYGRALGETLPHVPRATMFWRMHFLVGALLHSAAHHFTIEKLSGGLCRTDDVEDMLRHLVEFAEAGVGAPHVAAPPVASPVSAQLSASVPA
jgi:AcrR family transcriptional regulator